jgi:23S rRNA pseudouridine1911/1915/1917 synthase
MAAQDDRIRDFEIRVPSLDAPQRLDRYLVSCEELGLSRSRLQKLIADGLVLVDGERAAKKHLLEGGEMLTIVVPPQPRPDISAEDVELDVVFEDEFLAVINKPAGMVTHPGVGNFRGTLVNALMYRFEQLACGARPDRPGIVHRLDKNTSGLLLVAKTDAVLQSLQEAIQRRQVKRTYLALVCGHLLQEHGEVDLPIGRSSADRKLMAVTNVAGREAVTQFRRMARYRSYDLMEVSLLTGRTHQIRVHFSHLGHPVFGDPEYGGREKWLRGVFGPERPLARRLLELIRRQALHARRLEFVHPVTGAAVKAEAEPPGDFKAVLALLEREGV